MSPQITIVPAFSHQAEPSDFRSWTSRHCSDYFKFSCMNWDPLLWAKKRGEQLRFISVSTDFSSKEGSGLTTESMVTGRRHLPLQGRREDRHRDGHRRCARQRWKSLSAFSRPLSYWKDPSKMQWGSLLHKIAKIILFSLSAQLPD